MKQVTLRLPDDLARELSEEAARLGQSVNAYATLGFRAWLDPDAEGDDVERMRARLRRAGLLAEWEPATVEPPSARELERARRAAGSGKQLSEYVSEGRGA